jgi:hypothetical protein
MHIGIVRSTLGSVYLIDYRRIRHHQRCSEFRCTLFYRQMVDDVDTVETVTRTNEALEKQLSYPLSVKRQGNQR